MTIEDKRTSLTFWDGEPELPLLTEPELYSDLWVAVSCYDSGLDFTIDAGDLPEGE